MSSKPVSFPKPEVVQLIEGDIFRDQRGELRFLNAFDMLRVKRMYCITTGAGVVRAWQGHRLETKWFHAVRGSFLVKTVSIDNQDQMEQITLSDERMQVLEIPPGLYNGFEALLPGSMLMVFSDLTLEDSRADDFRMDLASLPW